MNIGGNGISARVQRKDGRGRQSEMWDFATMPHFKSCVFVCVFLRTKDRCPEFSSLRKQMDSWEVQIEDLGQYKHLITWRDNGRLWSI